MTLLLKVILSKPRMSKACQCNIREMKENAFTLTKVEALPFWINIDKTFSFTRLKIFDDQKPLRQTILNLMIQFYIVTGRILKFISKEWVGTKIEF